MRKPTQQEYFLAEAVIEIVDVIDWERKEFRLGFEDSRDFNATITMWAVEFLEWWDAEEAAGQDHIYLDVIRDFTLAKIDALDETGLDLPSKDWKILILNK